MSALLNSHKFSPTFFLPTLLQIGLCACHSVLNSQRSRRRTGGVGRSVPSVVVVPFHSRVLSSSKKCTVYIQHGESSLVVFLCVRFSFLLLVLFMKSIPGPNLFFSFLLCLRSSSRVELELRCVSCAAQVNRPGGECCVGQGGNVKKSELMKKRPENETDWNCGEDDQMVESSVSWKKPSCRSWFR